MKFAIHRILLGTALLAATSSAGASTYLVLPDGSGDAPTIAAALRLAISGDVIELGDGIFNGPGNEDLDFEGRPLTLRSRSGNPSACAIDPEATAGEAHRALLIVSGEGAGLRIEGVGFRGGFAAGGDATAAGGAVRIANSSPVFVNCRFVGNEARLGGAVSCAGGAPRFEDCVFTGNRGRLSGGALYLSAGANVTLAGCRFADNGADFGGALAVDAATASLAGGILTGNLAAERGGALYAGDHADLFLDACTLVGNGAPSGGGLALVTESTAQISASILAFGVEGEAVGLPWPGPLVTLECSDLYGNVGGDWTGDLAAQLGANGNIAADPLFCGGAMNGDLTLAGSSPCAAAQSACGQIGALPVGCAGRRQAGLSWSALKSLY